MTSQKNAILSSLLCLLVGLTSASEPPRPNVVLILADDMGYGEIEALNPRRSKIPTPCLNQLAAQGLAFTDAHSASSVCSPTRYAMLTGRYAWRTRLQKGVLTGNDQPLIAADRKTLGHFFQEHGYATAIVGKWHLNYEYEIPDALQDAPLTKKTKHLYPAPVPVGTTVAEGPITRGFDHFYGFHHAREISSIVRDDQIVEEIEIQQVLPQMTTEVVDYINQKSEAAKAGEPFFLYYAMSAPHSPIAPTDDWKGKGKLGTYADFIAQTDGAVGEVLAAIDRNGLADNTIVIFSADNGTSRIAKISKLEAKGHFPSGDLRGSKSDLWDGGHRVPFIARWPEHVSANSSTDQLICLNDLMATFAELFAVDLPPDTAEDSVSFLPVLLDRPAESSRTEIVHHSITGRFAIRR